MCWGWTCGPATGRFLPPWVSGPMLMLDNPHGIAQASLGSAMAVFEPSCPQAPPSQLCYDITGETYVTEAALAAVLQDMVPGLVTVPGPPAWNEGHLGPLLIGAARRDLRYTPRVSLRDGLAELAAGLDV